jgi:hypothetical protein
MYPQWALVMLVVCVALPVAVLAVSFVRRRSYVARGALLRRIARLLLVLGVLSFALVYLGSAFLNETVLWMANYLGPLLAFSGAAMYLCSPKALRDTPPSTTEESRGQ